MKIGGTFIVEEREQSEKMILRVIDGNLRFYLVYPGSPADDAGLSS